MNNYKRFLALSALVLTGTIAVGCGDDTGAAGPNNEPTGDIGAGGAGGQDAAGGSGATDSTGGGDVAGGGAGGEGGGPQEPLGPNHALRDGQNLMLDNGVHATLSEGGQRLDVAVLTEAQQQCTGMQEDTSFSNSTQVRVTLLTGWDDVQMAPPLVAQEYPLGESLTKAGITTVAIVELISTDDICARAVDETADVGTVTITGVSEAGIVGTFEVTLDDGDIVQGAFDTTTCVYATSIDGEYCVEDGQIF